MKLTNQIGYQRLIWATRNTVSVRTTDEVERYERITGRARRKKSLEDLMTERARIRNDCEEMMKETPEIVSKLMEEIITEESRVQ